MNLRLPALLGMLCVLASCHSRNPQQPVSLGYTVTPCGDAYRFLANEVECGTMVVAETRGSGNGRTVAFPVVTVRALNHAKADPVIWLHGGPGGGAIGGLPDQLKARRNPMTEDRDWIFLDQRGAGQSVPRLDCGDIGISDAGLTDDMAVEAVQACGRRLSAEGIDLSQYNVATVVKDLGDLRAALGIRAYNLFGVSYGSRVALGVMQHDPKDLRAVVLDSPWPPEFSWIWPQPELISRVTRQVLSLCAKDAACGAKHPQLESRFDLLMRQWQNRPPTSKGHQYSVDEVSAYLLDALYGDESARALPMVLEQMIAGDYSALDEYLLARNESLEGHFFAHVCKEELAFDSRTEKRGMDSKDPIIAGAARAADRMFAACEGFAVGAPDPVENQAVVSDIPTLLIAADIDAGCAAEFAQASAKSLSKSQVFTMSNMTHSVAARSPCAKRMIAAFFDQPEAKVDDSCIALDRPVFPFVL
jgi:pimeloyl-ACP methyl ester carboxylesterase